MDKIEYLLQCLQEECAEVIQAASKCNRFAIDGHYPDGKGNVEVLHHELCDVVAIVDMLRNEGVHIDLFDSSLTRDKIKRVNAFMALSIERGSLTDN